MDFRKLNGVSFRIWTYFCDLCKKRVGGIHENANRFLRGGCTTEIANDLNYNVQTVSQAIHMLKNAGFITEIRDPIDPRKYVYFLHVILMGEYVQLPSNAEKYARQLPQVFKQIRRNVPAKMRQSSACSV